MKERFVWILIILLQSLISGEQIIVKPQAQSLVLTNVTVVDVSNGETRPQMTVIVSGNRIVEIGSKVTILKNAQVDASGKFLIPGLWNMHAHALTDDRYEWVFSLLIAQGVTGARELGTTMPFEQ